MDYDYTQLDVLDFATGRSEKLGTHPVLFEVRCWLGTFLPDYWPLKIHNYDGPTNTWTVLLLDQEGSEMERYWVSGDTLQVRSRSRNRELRDRRFGEYLGDIPVIENISF